MPEREIIKGKLELLPKVFYKQDSLAVAPALIGCVFETNKDGIITSGRITETEAYPGDDAASHVYKRKPTPRTKTQYLEGGRLYVYQIMGLHLMTSVVVGDKNTADVVFIRSLEPLDGIAAMKQRRKFSGDTLQKLASGPGTLSEALGISKGDNGVIVYEATSLVRIYRDPAYFAKIKTGRRINLGIHGKGENEARIAVEREWRFFEADSKFLSKK